MRSQCVGSFLMGLRGSPWQLPRSVPHWAVLREQSSMGPTLAGLVFGGSFTWALTESLRPQLRQGWRFWHQLSGRRLGKGLGCGRARALTDLPLVAQSKKGLLAFTFFFVLFLFSFFYFF